MFLRLSIVWLNNDVFCVYALTLEVSCGFLAAISACTLLRLRIMRLLSEALGVYVLAPKFHMVH